MPEPKYNREDYLQDKKEPSFLNDLGGHLDELRWHIFRAILIIVLAFLICFYSSGPLLELLKALAPEGSSFFQLKPGELFMVSMKLSAVVAFFLTLPFLLRELYSFLRPALKEEEKKICTLVFILSPVLFYLGLAFAYYFLLPSLLDFLLNFKEGVVEKRYGLESFINLVLSIETITAISFQLPVVIFVLGILKLVKVKDLFSIWRYVVLFAFVLAAFLTPTPDPLTMSVLAIALLLLYFSTILILQLF